MANDKPMKFSVLFGGKEKEPGKPVAEFLFPRLFFCFSRHRIKQRRLRLRVGFSKKRDPGAAYGTEKKNDIGKISGFYIFLQLVRKTALIFEKKYIIIGV